MDPHHPEDGYEVVTFSDEGGVVTAAKGLQLVAQDSKASVPALDVLVYPGGRGTRAEAEGRGRARVGARASGRRSPLMTSVCTGALVYARRGAARRAAGDHALGLPRAAARAGPDHRGAAPTAVRRRRRPDHRSRRLVRGSTWRCTWSTGSPARRAQRGAAGDPVRPRAARVTCRPGLGAAACRVHADVPNSPLLGRLSRPGGTTACTRDGRSTWRNGEDAASALVGREAAAGCRRPHAHETDRPWAVRLIAARASAIASPEPAGQCSLIEAICAPPLDTDRTQGYRRGRVCAARSCCG